MTSFEEVNEAVQQLAALKFFPSNVSARLAIVRVIRDMATTGDQVRWLIRRALQLFDSWEGPRELRALFCSRWKPRDGIEATSKLYPEGFPPERKPDPNILIAPDVISADRQLDREVRKVAEMKDLNRRKP